MQRTIKETDIFQLLLKENIDSNDYQYLFMLYQPIIGINAVNLYLTLLQEKNLTDRINLDFNHTRLMLLLNINQNELLEAFQKLEIYHLVSSYYYPLKSTYIYQLKKPLSANKFFINEQLKNNLINKIGQLQFERQKYYFSKYQPEITADFINISHIHDINFQGKNLAPKIDLKNMLHNLKQNQTPIKMPIINNVATHQQITANLATPSTININNSTNHKTMIKETLLLMEEKEPEAYLVNLAKKPIEAKIKNTLKLIVTQYQLNNEVINCLLEYVWFKNNKRIEPNYILKIAKTFYENKINNINDALNHLKIAYKKTKKHSFSYKKNYQQDVLWTNENYEFNWKNSKVSETKDNLMSEKEITLILEELDKY